MASVPQEQPSASDTLIVLVHGTWAQGSPWTQQNSPIRREIADSAADAEIDTFVWSGRNSQAARHDASVALAEWLDAPERAHFRAIHLVGHSHGGGVATRVSALRPGRINSIVTLGTPFLVGEPVNSSRVLLFWRSLLGLILSLAAVVFVVDRITSGRPLTYDVPLCAPWWQQILPVALLLAVLLGVLAMWHWFSAFVAGLQRRRGEILCERYRGFATTSVTTQPIYYGVGDEAFGVISLGAGLGAALDRLRERGQALYSQIIMFSGIAALSLLAATLGTKLFANAMVTQMMFNIYGIVLLAYFGFGLAFGALLTLAHFNMLTPLWATFLTFGSDSAFASLFLDLRVVQRPIAGPVARDIVLTLAPDWRLTAHTRFRHCYICFDQEAIRRTAEWIREQVHAQRG